MDLPVTAAALIVARVSPFTRVRRIPGRKVSGRSVVRSAIGVGVRRRRIVSAVRVVISTTGWAVLLHGASRRRSVAGPVVVVLAGSWAAVSVVSLTAGAVRTRRATAIVLESRRHVWTTSTGRTGSPTLTGWHVRLGLDLIVSDSSFPSVEDWETYISNTLDTALLELATIELLNGCLEVRSGFKFDKSDAS